MCTKKYVQLVAAMVCKNAVPVLVFWVWITLPPYDACRNYMSCMSHIDILVNVVALLLVVSHTGVCVIRITL